MSDSIQIVAHIHPFAPQDRILKQILPGKSLEQIIADIVPHRIGRVIVAVDGEIVTDYKYIPKAGASIAIRVVPAGGDAQQNLGKAGGWTSVAGWAMIIVGGLTGQGWLVGVGAATLFSGVALVGSSILMDAFTPGGTSPRSEALPSIRGGRNRASPWGKVPCVFGTHLIQPMYAAKSYTSIDGTDGVDMYLHTIMAVSAHARTGGNILVSDIKIGETILATNAANELNDAITVDGPFSADVQVYNDGTNPSLFPEIVLEDAPGVELDSTISGDNMWRSTAPGTTKVSIDITLPRGLFSYNKDGAQQNHSVTVTVKRRTTGSGTAWAAATTVHTFSLTKSVTKTARYNFTETVSAGQYDYALTRSTNDPSDFKGTSMTQWSAFRSIKDGVRPIDADVQAKVCILAIKIKATADLQGTVDQINCIAKQSIPIFSGGNWSSFGYSENPAAIYLATLRGPMGQRPAPDALIDWQRFNDWYTTCNTNGWTCNLVIPSGSRHRDYLTIIGQTGRANSFTRDGLYSAVVDESKSTVIQHFAARNVRNFTWQKAFRDRPHALKVNYINAADGYAPAERIVYDDGYTIANATKFEQVQLAGITSAELAYQHGRYLLAVGRLRPEVYSFETDAEGIIAEPGDLVRIAHDSIAVGLISSRIKAVTMSGVNATAITIDELCQFETGKSYAVRIRLTSDNSTVYAAVNNAAGTESNTLIFTVAVATIPAVGDLVLFGEATIESLEALIVGVEAGDDLSMRLYATDRADAVHTADSGAIPAYDSKVSRPPQIGQSTAPPTVISTAVQKVVADAEQALIANATPAATAAPAGYRGAFTYAGRPTTGVEGNICVLYSATAGERGVYRWESGAWAKQTGPTVAMLSLAWPDISRATIAEADGGFAGGPYGTVADYVGTGANVFEVLAVQTAFVNKLMTNFLKVNASLRGGDRYDEAGATIDGTKSGFFFNGLTGGAKISLLEFEGTSGAGTPFGCPSIVGSSLLITGSNQMGAIAAMDGTDLAYIDGALDSLRMYRWNGAEWSLLGTALSVSGVAAPAISAMSNTDIAFYDSGNQQLRCYRFDRSSSSWSLVGSGLAIASTVTTAKLATLNATDVALINRIDAAGVAPLRSQLSTYRFNGSTWSLVGSQLMINDTYLLPCIATLSGNTIALHDHNNLLHTYQWSGSEWSKIGGSITTLDGTPSLTALNGTDVVWISSIHGTLRLYRFINNAWSLVSEVGGNQITTGSFMALSALNGTDVAIHSATQTRLYTYRFPFYLSKPHTRVITG